MQQSEAPSSGSNPERALRLWRLGVVVAVIVVFGSASAGEFVGWDDPINLYQNPRLNPPTLEGITYYWTHASYGLYIPLTYSLWGGLAALTNGAPDAEGIAMNPWVFHGFNVLLHVLSALAALALLARLLPAMAAGVGALLFALHPLQVEAVAWAAGMKDVLAGMLVLVALWQYIEFARASRGQAVLGGATALPPTAHYTLALAAFILAMLAKPSAMIAPAIAAALDLWLLRTPIRRVALALSPWLVLAALCAIVARQSQVIAGVEPAPLWARPLIAGDSLAFYLYKLVWPLRLGIDYGRTPAAVISPAWIYVAWLVPAAVAALLLWTRRRWPELFVGGVILVAGLLPVLGLWTFQFQYISTVADRYVYVAMLGPALGCGWLIIPAAARWGQTPAVIAIAVLLGVLGLRSILQVGVWSDNQALFANALRVHDGFVGNNGLGRVYTHQGELARAEPHLLRAVQIKPDLWLARENLAYIYDAQGRRSDAIDQRIQTMEILRKTGQPMELAQLPVTAISLARDLAILGRNDEAIVFLHLARERFPDDPVLRAAIVDLEQRRDAATRPTQGP